MVSRPDRIVHLVAGNELVVEHPDIVVALSKCRFVRRINVVLHLFLHLVYPAASDIAGCAVLLGITRIEPSESLEWEDGSKVTLRFNKAWKYLFHASVRLVFNILDDLFINLDKRGAALVSVFLENGDFLFPLDDIDEAGANLLFGSVVNPAAFDVTATHDSLR